MKRTTKLALLVCITLLACLMMFVACDSNNETPPPNDETQEGSTSLSITIEDDYLVLNGVKTEYKVHTEPTVTVVDGYVAVNGIKTDYEVNTTDVITIEDDYLVVNGVKTEHKVHTEPTITVEDGYLVVNGVKTEHEVKNKNHSFGDWNLYNEGENDCEKKLYYRTCPDCSTIEWKEGKYEDHSFTTVTTPATCQAKGYDTKTCNTCGKVEVCNETPITNHNYSENYNTDNSFHWFECVLCSNIEQKEEHIFDDNSGTCSVCNALVGATEGVIYTLSASGTYYEVTGYEGTAVRIRIAEEINNLPITKINQTAFKANSTITEIYIPDSIIEIESNSFAYCSALKKARISERVETISSGMFYECYQLSNITLGTNIKRIGTSAFYRCYSLGDISLPNGLVSIGGDAFMYSGLSSIIIPDTVTSIGSSAFMNSNISKVTLSKNLTSLSGWLFCNCPISSIIIPDSVTYIDSYSLYSSHSMEIVLSSSVRSIAVSAINSVSTVYFTGSKEEWNNINIHNSNSSLFHATKYYNYNFEE